METTNLHFMLFICLAFFAIGDFLGVISKAKISSVFVALMLFLIGFLTGIIPSDIIEQAGLSQLGKWASSFLIFHMGTSINLKQLAREWKTVVLAIISMVVAGLAILAISPIIGIKSALISIPIINGGILATKEMTERAAELNLVIPAALGTILYAVQKFIGTPPASLFGLREAESFIKKYREDKKKGLISTKKETTIEKISHKISFNEKYKKYFTDFTCLGIAALFAYLSYVLQGYTNISYSIWALFFGATMSFLGLVPGSIMAHAKSSGILSMAVFASIIPSLAKISINDMGEIAFHMILIFVVTLGALFLVAFFTPVWKLAGSKNITVGVFMAQLLGFPATFLIANEVATAVADNEEEKEAVLEIIMPPYVVAGFATVTTISVVIAGILKNFL